MKIRTTALVSALCAASLPLLAPIVASGSSHREAPNITRFPTVDSTDFYMFNSYEANRAEYVTLIANYLPLQNPYGGPNYFALDQAAVYEIHVDSDGDAVEDLTFQFRFKNRLAENNTGKKLMIGDQNVAVPLKNIGPISAQDVSALNFNESYTLTLVRGDRRTGQASPVTRTGDGATEFGKPYDFVGTKTFGSIAGYEHYAKTFIHEIAVPGCQKPGKVFVGQRDESFVVNLGQVFDLVNFVPVDSEVPPDQGGLPGGIGIKNDKKNDIISDANITTFALELPAACLTGTGNGVIGGWTSASMRQGRVLNPTATFAKPDVNGGAWTQVSRLSAPLVNELVIGLPDKDRFSASEPKDDGQFATYVTNPTLPALLDALFNKDVNNILQANPPIANLAPSNLPRQDLVTAFLTGFAGVNQQKTVTASEMLRLNTGIAAKPAAQQSTFGVAGNDLAGFPNGRRPGDDVVDIALRVVMGRLCHPVPVNGTPTDLDLCDPAQAPLGKVAFTDGAPISAADFDETFPYLRTPIPGATN
ncbi:MAG TPA: DUF4331 domain-containing protein [Steroidobacteraceae bacterium]|nr:DUF4331 domain-containing protein [Steroidobacteraceae bacterium]